MPSVFDVLGKHHREVERMLGDLETRPSVLPAQRANASQEVLRKKKVERLIMMVSGHEAAEEMYFWPAVREHLATGDALADQAIEQEQAGKRVLDALDRLDPGMPEFESLLAGFIKDARGHMFYEETAVWPKLSAVLSPQEAADLGQKVAEARKNAPTRPHPGAPVR